MSSTPNRSAAGNANARDTKEAIDEVFNASFTNTLKVEPYADKDNKAHSRSDCSSETVDSGTFTRASETNNAAESLSQPLVDSHRQTKLSESFLDREQQDNSSSDGNDDLEGSNQGGHVAGAECSVKRKRRPRPTAGTQQECAICGDEAFGYNFDALSCESCKAFFRRNAMRQHVCQNGNQCKIDKDSRKYCSSCRLTKCLDVGMKRELILTPDKLEKRAKLVRKKHLNQPADESTSTSALTTTSKSTPIGGATSATGIKVEIKFSSPLGRGTSTSSGEGEYGGSKGERRSGGRSSGSVAGVYDVPETESAAKQKRGGGSARGSDGGRTPSGQSVCSAQNVASQPDVMFSEMSRLGIGMNIAAAAAAAAGSGSGDAVPTSASYSYAEHFRDMYHQQTPPQAVQVKHEHQDSPSPSSAYSIVPSSESCVKLVAKLSQATIEYDEMLAKCGSACGQLLRPLNFSDMKQMRPANDASEQFNYGEVFVRRFVNVFKQIDEFRGLGQVAQLKLLRSAMVSTLNIAGVFSFDASRQAWVLQAEGCEERVYLIGDMVALFESSGQTHIRDYMRSYCEFHTRLRNELGSDVVLFFVLILIDLFSPHRFTTDRSMLSLLVPAHARYVQFLEMYLAKNYASVGVSGKPRIPEIGGRDSAFGRVGGGSGGSGIGLGSSVLPSEDEAVKQKLDFCLDMLLQARTLEEYLAVTSQFIGLSAMVPLLAEVCEQQLNEGY